jgi:hypothetical protein
MPKIYQEKYSKERSPLRFFEIKDHGPFGRKQDHSRPSDLGELHGG